MKHHLYFRVLFVLFSICLPFSTFSKQIETFYGPIEVNEPVLLDLIDSPAFQRLKLIHQYGIAYYLSYPEEYNRYDHCIGVFTILRAKGASLEEQIAGLLHDVSHTAFSHVGDWIFNQEEKEKSYQDGIHPDFLDKSGLGIILQKHGFTISQILPKEELFPALENHLPNLCADRIDYNIQGAYYQGFITREEAKMIFEDIQFIDHHWVSSCPELMKKIVRFSLFMTQNCWGSATNHLTSRWLADAILKMIELGDLTFDELHFGTDQMIWDQLICHSNPFVQQRMKMILNAGHYFSIVDSSEADQIIKSKFRGVDPWIILDDQCFRLTSLDCKLAEEYQSAKQFIEKGWAIKLHINQ